MYGGSNDFGKKSLDDLYSYALYISGINNENLDLLLNSEIKDTKHLVVAADSVTHDPIKGATVTLGTQKGISDENGRVWFDNVKADKKLATVKLPVVAGQNTAVVTKVKGALDAMKRATSKVYITMNVKNNSADLDKVEIQNAFKNGFEILESDLDKKQITIGIKSAYDIAAGNHQIPLNIYLTDGSKHLAYAKVAVKSTKCTLQKAQKHYMLISAKNMVAEGQIKASIPSDEGIVSIEQVSGQDKFILEDKKSGMYEIRVVQKGKLKKGTYKIKCNVHTENEVKNDKGISYTITIEVK